MHPSQLVPGVTHVVTQIFNVRVGPALQLVLNISYLGFINLLDLDLRFFNLLSHKQSSSFTHLFVEKLNLLNLVRGKNLLIVLDDYYYQSE